MIRTKLSFTGCYLERRRIEQLLEKAMDKALIKVCAGAGYGKTHAVYSFLKNYPAGVVWLQLSESDNVSSHVWEKYVNVTRKIHSAYAEWLEELGFPENEETLLRYCEDTRLNVSTARRVVVLDDFHLLHNPEVLHFCEASIANNPKNVTTILISRKNPSINCDSLLAQAQIETLDEKDLCFTQSELADYFSMLNIPFSTKTLSNVMQKTKGWTLEISAIAHALQKAPDQEINILRAFKVNAFRMFEFGVWTEISEELRHFLILLSLIDHLSADLVSILTENKALLYEMENIHAYVRYNSHLDIYVIHHLFLEFLKEKQGQLTDGEKCRVYKTAGDWCACNYFNVDAVSYYEKSGDYEKIVAITLKQPTQIPGTLARFLFEVFERTPEEVFDTVELSAFTHIRAATCSCFLDKARKLMNTYEKRYLALPDSPFKFRMLGCIYYCMGIMSLLACTANHCYDFNKYFERQDLYLSKYPVTPGNMAVHPVGPWFFVGGSPRKEAFEEYIKALCLSEKHVSHCFQGAMSGETDATIGELLYFQNDIKNAAIYFNTALKKAREHKQFEVVNRILNYQMRMAFLQGKRKEAEEIIKHIETQIMEEDYCYRYETYDITLGWYYYFLRQSQKIPDAFRSKFTSYGHASFLENLGNQVRAHSCFLTKKYHELLSYIREMKTRESVLYGRVEMLAMEACIHHHLKDSKMAFATLKEAYETALPCRLILPFTTLGRDMWALTAAALRNGCDIPADWLEQIHHLSSSFSKRQTRMIGQYMQEQGCKGEILLSKREKEILTELSHGLSRSEIASNLFISINTVKMIITSLHNKCGAVNTPHLIRIALENKLI